MDEVNSWTGRANAYFELDQYEDALGSYEKALAIDAENAHALTSDPENAKIWNIRGTIHKKMHDLPSALADFDHALAVNPRIGDNWLNRGIILLQMNRDHEALESFEHALSLNPGDRRAQKALTYLEKRVAAAAGKEVRKKD